MFEYIYLPENYRLYQCLNNTDVTKTDSHETVTIVWFSNLDLPFYPIVGRSTFVAHFL